MSEPGKCLSVGNNFSRREWLMLIVILLMLEAGALISSHAFMSNQDVINYISFASTIASLLLAVLAIVYGFYQSESQKRTGDGIEMHLSHLRSTTDEMRAVSTNLVESSKGISGFSEDLRSLDRALQATQEKLNGIEGGVQGISKNQEQVNRSINALAILNSPNRSTKDAISIPNENSGRLVLMNRSSLVTDAFALALHSIYKKHSDRDINTGSLIGKLSEELGKIEFLKSNENEWVAYLLLLVTIFVSVGLVEEANDDGGPYEHIRVSSKNFEAIEESYKQTMDLEKLRPAIETISKINWSEVLV